MARQFSVTGNYGNVRRCEAIIRLCRSATEIDPNYATAWALMAVAQAALKFYFNGPGDGGLAAAERALSLDENLAEAHAAKSQGPDGRKPLRQGARRDRGRPAAGPGVLRGQHGGGAPVLHAAPVCRRDQVLRKGGGADGDRFLVGQHADDLVTRLWATGTSRDCRAAHAGARREDHDPGTGQWHCAGLCRRFALRLGEAERAKDLAKRAMLLDPDNLTMRYNFACGFAALARIRRRARPAGAGFRAGCRRDGALGKGRSGSRRDPRSPALQGHDCKGGRSTRDLKTLVLLAPAGLVATAPAAAQAPPPPPAPWTFHASASAYAWK